MKISMQMEEILGVQVFACIVLSAKISPAQCLANRTRREECLYCKNIAEGHTERPAVPGVCSGCGTSVRNNSRYCTPCQKVCRLFEIGSPEWQAGVDHIKGLRDTGKINTRGGRRWLTDGC